MNKEISEWVCPNLIVSSFFRFSAKCGDWGALSFCQHVDGPKFLPGCCFHHAGLCEFSDFLLTRLLSALH